MNGWAELQSEFAAAVPFQGYNFKDIIFQTPHNLLLIKLRHGITAFSFNSEALKAHD